MLLLDPEVPGRARTALADRVTWETALIHPVPQPPALAPEPEALPPAERLARDVVASVIRAAQAGNTDRGGALRVGVMLSSARPGVKKMNLVLTDRSNPRRQLECAVVTSPRGGDLVLTSDCLGRAEEVGRASVDDAAAPAKLGAAAERYVRDAVARVAAGDEGC